MTVFRSNLNDTPPDDSGFESNATSMFSAVPKERQRNEPTTYQPTEIFEQSLNPSKADQNTRRSKIEHSAPVEQVDASTRLFPSNLTLMRGVENQCAELNEVLGAKYKVIRRINGGGMAEVFLAQNVDHGAFFAVKVLAAHLAQNPRVVARFEEEARLEARLSGHPNIVPVFDIGAGNGLHYIVMPYVQGQDLASFLQREGRVRSYDAANLVAQVAEALSWAEAKGVVHRDLKPANIRLDTSGRAIVLDFGIAKASYGSGDITLPGEGLGTPFYMSPEQFLGEECDPRSDLYSLGVVFFELLTGERPFKGDTFPLIRKAHLAADRPLIRSCDPELPAPYETIVLKLLQKDPENRFQTAKDLLAALSKLGVKSDRSALLPGLDQDPIPAEARLVSRANSLSPKPEEVDPSFAVTPTDRQVPSPVVVQPSKRRWQAIGALGVIALTAIFAIVAVLALSRPRALIADAAGSMVLVPGGDFVFGDDSPLSPNRRQKKSLKKFYVDQTEVSNAEYKRFCDATGHSPPASAAYLSQPLYPVADVTFADAQAYAAWAGKRLPTEEEWEKSARGSDGRPYPWGWDPWTEGIPHDLQPVDSFKARQSPVGALNMAGNVYEWTASPFPAGDADFAAFKGGANLSRQWNSIKGGTFFQKDPRHFLTYTRGGWPKDAHSPYIGFRCVRDVSAPRLAARVRSLFAR